MLYPVVESCLTAEVFKAWDRHKLNREVPQYLALEKEKALENLMTFLRRKVEGEERRILAENGFGSKTNQTEFHKQVQRDEPTATTLVANTYAGKISCIFCDRPHSSQDCQEMPNKSYEDQKLKVILRRCCLVCLKPGHMAKKYHSSAKYLSCGKRHYVLLCPDLRKENPSSPKDKGIYEEALLINIPTEQEVYLKTLMIRLRHKDKEICVRALLDDGSHHSYVEKDLVEELKLCPSGKETFSKGICR
ncbi:uncharacterized protein TNCT_461931 [Trichonephila clavata]|uniref:Uncharacterized protein n=1 Tax=Trichonephila clavata TaxID=2740835 RepID=A0A8X6LIF1_TRICU|nr:uncharacterized protein TNCT_461931 [Trichonephila clavata]